MRNTIQPNTKILTAAAFAFAMSASITLASPPTAQDQLDFTQINSACASDAQTAGCAGDSVGKGLLKCLGMYKRAQWKTNKAFRYSQGCEAAIHQLRIDKKSGK